MNPSEDSTLRPSGQAVVVDVDGLSVLFDALRGRGYTVVGPTVRDGAIVVAELASVAELPFGWGVETEAGRYRLRERADTAAFGHSAGPQSWKSVLHPARARLWSADRATGSVEAGETAEPPRYALLGVRPCDVRAVGLLDQVLTAGRHADPVYRGRRDGAFIIAVECTEPGATCFCTSMGCGPGVESGFDLAMTELADAEGHRFVVRAGTPAGADVLADVPSRAADEATIRRASTAVDEAAGHMGRTMPTLGLPQLLADSRESPHWDDVASRCLTCGNCTMVCPTCFCTTTEDVTDLVTPGQYAIDRGTVASTGGLRFAPAEFEDHVIEEQVPHSTALHAQLAGRGRYLTGPTARYTLSGQWLSPVARQAADAAGLGADCRNPYRSILVRAVEVVYAVDEALRLIERYEPPAPCYLEVPPRAAVGHGATEAPRGTLFHRYAIDAEGLITSARIVPPTSQNQASIEDDLRRFVAGRLDLDDQQLTWQCEQAIRNYDPCISCATHFLDLTVDRA